MDVEKARRLAASQELLREKLGEDAAALLALREIVLDYTDTDRELEEARSNSLTDALTGLSNRRAFDADVSFNTYGLSDPRPVDQRETPVIGHALGLADLDGFKTINDNYGHEVGDRVLQLSSFALRRSIRTGDKLYRFGGDEFVALFPLYGKKLITPEDLAMGFTSRFDEEVAIIKGGGYRAMLDGLGIRPNEVEADALKTFGFGASFGFVVRDNAKVNLPSMLAEADKAMYHIKGQRKAKRGQAPDAR